ATAGRPDGRLLPAHAPRSANGRGRLELVLEDLALAGEGARLDRIGLELGIDVVELAVLVHGRRRRRGLRDGVAAPHVLGRRARQTAQRARLRVELPVSRRRLTALAARGQPRLAPLGLTLLRALTIACHGAYRRSVTRTGWITGSPCGPCAVRTSGSTSEARCDSDRCASTSRSGSCAACTP